MLVAITDSCTLQNSERPFPWVASLGGKPMQPLPPNLELPEGDRFTLPTISAVRELVPPGGQLPAHMVLMMICGKELWVPLDREIARQMANVLAPFRE